MVICNIIIKSLLPGYSVLRCTGTTVKKEEEKETNKNVCACEIVGM